MFIMQYNLEIEKAITAIKKNKSKKVLIQLPDGLKPQATQVVDELEEKTNAEISIWQSTCFGACDVPLEVERFGYDLIIQFGHSACPYKKSDKDIKII